MSTQVSITCATEQRRKLHIGHFAFARAVVQGIPIKESWDRYVRVEGDPNDVRTVRATIRWIRDELAAIARRAQRHGVARLVRIELNRGPAVDADLPSLEDFVAARGLDGFSESEQLAQFEEAYGGSWQRGQRVARLIDRQLEAIFWLQRYAAEVPHAADPIAAWFHPGIAGRLERAGLTTLSSLVERINGTGRHWARSIAAIGPTKAERIVAWLREQEPNLKLAIARHVSMSRSRVSAHELEAVVRPATAIRPLEKFIVPAALDGSQGRYRRPQGDCLLDATNDYQAILAWIRSKRGLSPEARARKRAGRRVLADGIQASGVLAEGTQTSLLPESTAWLAELSDTQRAYRKEGERFLLWAIVERKKPLSSMTQEDCTAYREFLADPQPAALWCGTGSFERWSPLWRPFRGPLSAAAQHQAITILGNLYGFLVDQNYLMGNPWSAVSVPVSFKPRLDPGRSLTFEQWRFVDRELSKLSESSQDMRLRLALRWLYATGLRLSEIVTARVDDLTWVEYPADADEGEPITGWLLQVVGKGQKVREVPVPAELVGELSHYLEVRGLPPDPGHVANCGVFILGKVRDESARLDRLHGDDAPYAREEGIATSTLYKAIKSFFEQCSKALRPKDRKGADRLLQASTHWLRHSHASHSIARGTPIEIAQQNLGHASLATTTLYVTTEKKRRMQAMQEFWEGRR